MYTTLSTLKANIDRMVEQMGPNATVAAFVFTKEDVSISDWDADVELDFDSLEQAYPGIIDRVLSKVGDSDSVYGQINDSIEDEIKIVRRKGSV